MPALPAILLALPATSGADSIWERRDPNVANLFEDYRARRVGDLLTVVVSESTEFEGQEKREMNKETKSGFGLGGSGNASAGGKLARNFGSDLDGQTSSQRRFDGKANSTIDRRFTDRMTVVVVDVLPNGNLVVEGFRQRVMGRESRMLRITGLVRPADIGAYNTVLSQYIGNFQVMYDGRGPDSNFTNQGWGGRLFNRLWPY